MAKQGKIDVTKLTDEELAILARHGDKKAFAYLWEKIIPDVRKVVNRFAKNSGWVRSNREDVAQGVLCKFPTFIKRYDADKLSTTFSKWLHHTLVRITQDVLRQQKDSLGICIPQKVPYPTWTHLGSFSESASVDMEWEIHEGIKRIDRGEQPNLDPSSNLDFVRPKKGIVTTDIPFDW